jgi:hypothetical protein
LSKLAPICLRRGYPTAPDSIARPDRARCRVTGADQRPTYAVRERRAARRSLPDADVRLTQKATLLMRCSEMTRWANSGLMHCSAQRLYSIISSAMESTFREQQLDAESGLRSLLAWIVRWVDVYDDCARHLREIGRRIGRKTVGEIVLLRIVVEVCERKDDDR